VLLLLLLLLLLQHQQHLPWVVDQNNLQAGGDRNAR
jgi:hypothetical protein